MCLGQQKTIAVMLDIFEGWFLQIRVVSLSREFDNMKKFSPLHSLPLKTFHHSHPLLDDFL